ncbi:MAG: dehydrogenase [ubiquinone] 1 alpha subcomplex assembly factor 7 [Alphaproteobacteria bacterium]|nr:dehydrogenase [ubiquinone] 1 alpha subcomplex assembly factor 7 [Alphaproteobacteria bacterium]
MANEAPPLEAEIRRLISIAGPMPIAQYMATCLSHPIHGYYMTRDPFGATGDFITAPEISQMFGELIGLWAGAVWRQMGSPENIRLVELGPGRGTMMADALRAAKVVPDFHSAIVVHLVELSPVLQQVQQQRLERFGVPVLWHKALEDVPDGPAIILANEFFDALPVHQAIKQEDGRWHERVVMADSNGNFMLGAPFGPLPHLDRLLPPRVRDAPPGSVFEWRTDSVALEIGRRVARNGAALVIDYGHVETEVGDTVQAVGEHAYVNPLVAQGLVDLTAHVDFQSLAEAAESIGARIHGPLHQGKFLRRLGIETRAATLKAKAPPDTMSEIDAQVERLTGSGAREMGTLFKVLGIGDPKLGMLPGFEP